MIITFEGLDGSGKSTQLHLLHSYLTKINRHVCKYSDPHKYGISADIRNILLHSSNKDIHSLTELLLYQASRSDLVMNNILPSSLLNDYTLIDRFIDSTVAYQGYGRNIKLDIIHTLNSIVVKDIIIDKTFYIRIGIDTFIQRLKHKKKDRIESSSIEFFERVILGYDTIADNNKERFTIIDGVLSIKEIHRMIINEMDI